MAYRPPGTGEDRPDRPGTLITAVALTGAGAQNGGAVAAGLILLGLGWSATTVAGSTLLVASLTHAQRVPVQGFFDATMSLAGALGSATSGPVMGSIAYPGISAVAAVGIAAAAVVLLRLSARHRRHLGTSVPEAAGRTPWRRRP